MKKQAFPIILAAALAAVALSGGNHFYRSIWYMQFRGRRIFPFLCSYCPMHKLRMTMNFCPGFMMKQTCLQMMKNQSF